MKRILLMVFTLMCFAQISYAHLCPRCRFNNANDATYCIQCGQPLVTQSEYFYCPRCGFQNPYGSNFCGNCGDELRYDSPASPPQQGYIDLDFSDHGDHNDNDHENHTKTQKAAWRLVTTISGNGEKTAQELPGGGAMHKFMLKGTSGSMIINTFVIREGGEAEHFPIATRFAPGQEVVKDLPREYNSTGFRVSREGKGSIEVYVQ